MYPSHTQEQEQTTMEMTLRNFAMLYPNYDLSGWSGAQDGVNDLSTARAITGCSSSNEYATPQSANPSIRMHNEHYQYYNMPNGTYYPRNSNSYTANVPSYPITHNEVPAPVANLPVTYYPQAAAYMQTPNIQAPVENIRRQYMPHAVYSQMAQTPNTYTSCESLNNSNSEYLTTERIALPTNGYVSSEIHTEYINNTNVDPRNNNNMKPNAGDWMKYNTKPPIKQSFSPFPKSTSDKNVSYSSVISNGNCSISSTQSVKKNYKGLPKPVGFGRQAELRTDYLNELEKMRERETISETISPAETQSSGLSSFSGLSSHSSNTVRFDDSFMKLRFKDDETVVMNQQRNVLDLASNIRPFNKSFSCARLRSILQVDRHGNVNPEYAKYRSLYERLEEGPNTPSPTRFEPCAECGYCIASIE